MKEKHKLTFDQDFLRHDSWNRTLIHWQDAVQPLSLMTVDAHARLPGFESNEIAGDERNTAAPITSPQKIIGDDRNNTLRGTNRDDVIKGKGGNDILQGLAGSDNLSGDEGNDKLFGGAGSDGLNGGKGRDFLDGGAGNDLLYDTSGENITDTLRGGAGSDSLRGGRGRDILEGGSGNDDLFGSPADGSVDTLRGGTGNDRYLMNVIDPAASDLMFELPDQGIDIVSAAISSASWTLPDNIENLMFGTTLTATITGNALDNVIQGGLNNNTIQGIGGNDLLSGGLNSDDVLVGGEGADRFLFDANATMLPPNIEKRLGIDTITDFISGTDKIALARDTFSALRTAIGQDLGSEFASVANDASAETANALIVFSQASQKLFYNSNGSTAGFGLLDFSGAFAIVKDVPNLTSADFQVVASGLANLF